MEIEMEHLGSANGNAHYAVHVVHPVCVSDAMAGAVHRRLKTQARWPVVFDVVRFCTDSDNVLWAFDGPPVAPGERTPLSGWQRIERDAATSYCPHRVGERLRIRERFCVGYPTGDGHYSAIPWTGSDPQRDGKVFYAADRVEPPDEPSMPWIQSSHMPRWASRSLLEVTEVRIQRLWDISEADAEAEGIMALDGTLDDAEICRAAKAIGETADEARSWFMAAWARIHRGEPWGWEHNPWVWAETFKRVTP